MKKRLKEQEGRLPVQQALPQGKLYEDIFDSFKTGGRRGAKQGGEEGPRGQGD